MKVIDVSYHNGNIDFAKVRAAGYKGVIIRAGYGTKTVDKKFIQNIKGAIAAGMHIGVYWFMYCKNAEEARQNAVKCVQTIEPYKKHINLSVWSDYEYDSDRYAPGQTVQSRTEFVEVFNSTVAASGYECGTYTNIDYYNNKFDKKVIDKRPKWIARYASKLGDYDCLMWQHTSSGQVPGINGKVDLNVYYGDVKEECKGDGLKMRTIKNGSRGMTVMIWQMIIGVKVDGIFGRNTEEVTKKWQLSHMGAAEVDGIVGQKTWKAGLEGL